MSNMSERYTECQELGIPMSIGGETAPIATEPTVKTATEAPKKELTKAERRQKTIEDNEKKVAEIVARPIGKIDCFRTYWETCWAMTYIAGDLASHDKLIITYRDKSKRHNVVKVIKNKEVFPNGIFSVKDARFVDLAKFWKLVDDINYYAVKRGMDQVHPATLLGILYDPKVRERFRNAVRKHAETDHPPFEADEVPARDFRKPC